MKKHHDEQHLNRASRTFGYTTSQEAILREFSPIRRVLPDQSYWSHIPSPRSCARLMRVSAMA